MKLLAEEEKKKRRLFSVKEALYSLGRFSARTQMGAQSQQNHFQSADCLWLMEMLAIFRNFGFKLRI